MAQSNEPNSKPEEHESTTTGDRPFLPRLPSDPLTVHPVPRSLEEFRSQEGEAKREERLREVWHQLPKLSPHHGRQHGTALPDSAPASGSQSLTPESAGRLKQTYTEELWGRCGGRAYGFLRRPISWEAFKAYAEAKEAGMCRPFPLGLFNHFNDEQNSGQFFMTNWTSTETAISMTLSFPWHSEKLVPLATAPALLPLIFLSQVSTWSPCR
jgi:hypothetical protein